MPRVTYIHNDGSSQAATVRSGLTVMEAAIRAGVPGIDADCGGVCACATCCVFVASDWADVVPPPSGGERAMIGAAVAAGPNLRLSCQIRMTPALDGLVVRIPPAQR